MVSTVIIRLDREVSHVSRDMVRRTGINRSCWIRDCWRIDLIERLRISCRVCGSIEAVVTVFRWMTNAVANLTNWSIRRIVLLLMLFSRSIVTTIVVVIVVGTTTTSYSTMTSPTPTTIWLLSIIISSGKEVGGGSVKWLWCRDDLWWEVDDALVIFFNVFLFLQ